MPWRESSAMSQRMQFVREAASEGTRMAPLCRAFGISRKTGYKWLGRYEREGEAGLQELSRRPKRSPTSTAAAVVEAVLAVREAHPTWGGRKIRAYLAARWHEGVPAASTITDILRRHGCIDEEAAAKHRPWQRFEMKANGDIVVCPYFFEPICSINGKTFMDVWNGKEFRSLRKAFTTGLDIPSYCKKCKLGFRKQYLPGYPGMPELA